MKRRDQSLRIWICITGVELAIGFDSFDSDYVASLYPRPEKEHREAMRLEGCRHGGRPARSLPANSAIRNLLSRL